MVTGIDSFKEWFKGFEEQYVIIGGTACDILMTEEGIHVLPQIKFHQYVLKPITFFNRRNNTHIDTSFLCSIMSLIIGPTA